MARRGEKAPGVRDGYLRGALPRTRTARQVDVLAAFVAAGGSVPDAAALVGIQPSTAKRHLADLRGKSGLSTEQVIYRGQAEGWLLVPSLESRGTMRDRSARHQRRPADISGGRSSARHGQAEGTHLSV